MSNFLSSRSYTDEFGISYYFDEDVSCLKDSALLLIEVRDRLVSEAQPGNSTMELNKLADSLIKENGGFPLFFAYKGFPYSICTSCNESIVHGLPNKKKLKEGDVLSIDLGVKLNNYCSDSARTIAVGGVESKHTDLINIAESAFWKGFEQALPGNTIGDISNAIHSEILSLRDSETGEALFGVFEHFTGHGIGLKLHEAPFIYNYGFSGSGATIKPGMSFCIEPVVLYSNAVVSQKTDNFTYYTKDKSPSSHYENHVYVSENGPIVLT